MLSHYNELHPHFCATRPKLKKCQKNGCMGGRLQLLDAVLRNDSKIRFARK
jgi:hypothetical protein